MRGTQHTWIRRLAAFLLLAVLVYVQGVKAFHRHEGACGKHYSGTSLPFFKHAHDCAICDYHLCKDAVLPDLPGIPQTLLYISSADTISLYNIISSYADTTSDRGPPASYC